MPIASILIPVYNREGIIHKTIESAQNQTVGDIEIIIVDNCSTDNSHEICMSFAKQDDRVKLYKNEFNIGPVRNWQKCAHLATAPYSKLLFSDDLISANFLEKTIPYLLSGECALAITPAIIGENDWQGGINYSPFLKDSVITSKFFIYNAVYLRFFPVSPGAALFRTTDMKNNILTNLQGIFDYDFTIYGAGPDWLLFMLTAMNYSSVAYLSEPLVFFRSHRDSITIKNENNMVNHGYLLAMEWFKNRFNIV